MNALLRKSFSVAASAAVAAFMLGNACAQQAKVVAEKPSFDDIPSPEFTGGKQKSFKPKEWLEIEAKLRVSLSPEPKSKTCEKLLVKWYIAVKNPEKSGSFLLLSKSIEHVNVPLDEDIYCSVYMSPASIKRLTGNDGGGKNAVEFVGYEVLVNGEKVAAETNKGSAGMGGRTPAWWQSDKLSQSDTVPLLTKAETPFATMWWDRYAEVAAPGNR